MSLFRIVISIMLVGMGVGMAAIETGVSIGKLVAVLALVSLYLLMKVSRRIEDQGFQIWAWIILILIDGILLTFNLLYLDNLPIVIEAHKKQLLFLLAVLILAVISYAFVHAKSSDEVEVTA